MSGGARETDPHKSPFVNAAASNVALTFYHIYHTVEAVNEMPSVPSSLRSSFDLTESDASVPIQLDTENIQPQRTSILRRVSSATSSFFRVKTRVTSSEDFAEEETGDSYNRLGIQNETLGHEDYFGTDFLSRSLTIYDEEDGELINDAQLKEYFPSVYDDQGDEIVDTVPSTLRVRERENTVVSVFQTISKKMGFWDDEFASQRMSIYVTLLKNYAYILTGFICALCIYWGAYYDRSARYKNLKFAVVSADAQMGNLTPILGEIVSTYFQNSAVKQYGNFDLWNYTRIFNSAATQNISIEQEVLRQVHNQHYLAAFFVHENATAKMFQALSVRNASFNPSTDLLSVFYETGSDYNAMTNYVSAILQSLCQSFAVAMRSGTWSRFWLRVLNTDQTREVFSETPALLTSLPNFLIIDRLPVINQVVQAPLQVGLIYLCIFTFFQFLFSVPIHMFVASKIKGGYFVIFRIATAQGAYFVLSLSYVVLNTAFGINYRATFGNSGFLVVWAIAFLTMSAVGSLIEYLVLICIVLKPAMIGVCLLLVSVLNLAPTISPIYLCPTFYRYGYAMPVYNSYHLLQPALFNSWKGKMGRHFGILVAWSISTNALMPFAMKWVGRKMQQKKAAAVATVSAKNEAAEDSEKPQNV